MISVKLDSLILSLGRLSEFWLPASSTPGLWRRIR